MAKRYVRLLYILCNSTVSAVESVTIDYLNMLSQNYSGRPEGNKHIIHYYGALADAVRVLLLLEFTCIGSYMVVYFQKTTNIYHLSSLPLFCGKVS